MDWKPPHGGGEVGLALSYYLAFLCVAQAWWMADHLQAAIECKPSAAENKLGRSHLPGIPVKTAELKRCKFLKLHEDHSFEMGRSRDSKRYK